MARVKVAAANQVTFIAGRQGKSYLPAGITPYTRVRTFRGCRRPAGLRYIGRMTALSYWSPQETSRLKLRRPERSDFTAVWEIRSDPRTTAGAHRPGDTTNASFDLFFAGVIKHWDLHGFGVWSVEARSHPGRLIGFAGVQHLTVQGRPALNLTYTFHPDTWANGFATETARKALLLAQVHIPELPVVACTTGDDVGGQRTAVAAGLRREPLLDLAYRRYTKVYFTKGWNPAGGPGPGHPLDPISTIPTSAMSGPSSQA
jgi:RimJ/RimL family protein N-acetyltransferase